MTDILELVREDLRDFAGYRSARSEGRHGEVWLNANESPWPSAADPEAGCQRYPEPQPQPLRAALAALYGCTPERLLVGRGSDEAIDLLVRALCTPGRDAVVVTPPVFGMYAVSTRLQGAPLLEVPLHDSGDAFAPNFEGIAAVAESGGARLVFLCSPGNPTGGAIALADIARLARRLQGRAMVVVDEAYAEYASTPSATTLLADHHNLAVLRTLSKAHALAAARIGCVIADPALIGVLRACQAPYPVPAPCTALALAALLPAALAATRRRVEVVLGERDRMRDALADLAGIRAVYASEGNFLLVRFDDAEAALRRLLDAGVVVRDQRAAPGLQDALRITIGAPDENDRVLAALNPSHVRGSRAGVREVAA
jgi:histidinol-phosphate aminotransferase